MNKEKNYKLFKKYEYEICKIIEEIMDQCPIRPPNPCKEVQEKYEKILERFFESKEKEIRKRFKEMGFELKDTESK